MATIRFTVNGTPAVVDVDSDMPLLWVLRDILGLTGTKYGCGISQYGACTVHINGDAVRSCVTEIGNCQGKAITTVEGLSKSNDHPLQIAWQELDVPQCGYCQPGLLMTAADLLRKSAHPSDADIDDILGQHICRCGTYARVRMAVHAAASTKGGLR